MALHSRGKNAVRYFYTQYTDFKEENKTADKELSELSALNDYALKSYNETLHAQIISQMVEIKTAR